jgi:hypothetical protein
MKLIRTSSGNLWLDDKHYFDDDDFIDYMDEKHWGEKSYKKIRAYIEEHGPSMIPDLIEKYNGDYWGVVQGIIMAACDTINFDD